MAMAREQHVLMPTGAETALVWFERIVAAYCLLFGVLYWIRIIGFYPGTLWRFDLMPVQWRIAATVLAALFPFAGIGLWMLASWGPVIWFICAATESAMYVGFPALFGQRTLIVAAHLFVALIYIALRLVIYFQKRQTA